jgi:hypothetical protein
MKKPTALFSFCYILFAASLFATNNATSATISEQLYPTGGYFDATHHPQIEFTVHNTTSVLISSFAISNSGAI